MQTKGTAIAADKANWSQLLNWSTREIYRGTVFRCLKANWPYEDVVDFMVVVHPDSPCGFSLIVATGYKAGHILLLPPAEAKTSNADALATEWITTNWTKWIYPECPVELVQVLENYPSQVQIEGAALSASRDLELP